MATVARKLQEPQKWAREASVAIAGVTVHVGWPRKRRQILQTISAAPLSPRLEMVLASPYSA